MADRYDVIVVGGGPAGAACATVCASAGLKTLVLEKALFPRDKVCGDCLNPRCWPVFDRLGITDRILALPHAKLRTVEFIGIGAPRIEFGLVAGPRGEVAVKRAALDQALLDRAAECGANIRQNCGVIRLEPGWKVESDQGSFTARNLVAADGRNSTVARLLRLMPGMKKDRVALQTHLPLQSEFAERISLRLLREGYCGVADVGDAQMNLCLVSRPANLNALKLWASEHFPLSRAQPWRTIAPLARRPIVPSHGKLWLIGDAARVVEPFTGEGIYYAIATGELAARHLSNERHATEYVRAHAELYRGRLWINELAKLAVLHPRAGSLALAALRKYPGALRWLTEKVVG